MSGNYHENTREAFVGKFLTAPVEGGTEILFAGALLVTVEREDRLPAGFHDRLVRMIMDLLTARRTALWDEQAVFGDRPADDATVRAAAAAWALEEERLRDAPPSQ